MKQNSHTTTKCPYTKIFEDIFKISNKTSNASLKDAEKATLFLKTIANVTTADDDIKTDEEELVDHIIASINKIKSNLPSKTSEETKLGEAIILNIPKNKNITYRREDTNPETENEHKSNSSKINVYNDKVKNNKTQTVENVNSSNDDKTKNDTDTSVYVEVLTIEPNNTSSNRTSNNIMEVLKHLMPTMDKGLHNITIIEKNQVKNHSYSTVKNISTIVVTYCDKENYTKANVSFDSKETILKIPGNVSDDYDLYMDDGYVSDDEGYDDVDVNMTVGEKRDILEASEYGIQKMHELYSVLEPKLYSMGLWLDDTNPARYVAAFNAPSEDVAKFSRYGYASVQAATKLKELIG
ncbi:hypothetical protein O0L34_g8538 [Tuta absoluta]|nr:hypothetical protein O0L34_g8538 [Tuta absoluta]